MRKLKVNRWVLVIVIIVGLLLAARFIMPMLNKTSNPVIGQKAIAVTVAQAVQKNVVPQLQLNGSLEGETSAPISAKISGRVIEVLVEDGQAVETGQALVVLESVELNNSVRVAQDGVNRASANYENALADYNRYQTLYQQNAISRQNLDSIETKLKSAQADLSSAAANLSSAEQQLQYATITAPISGVVANKTVAVGQVLAPGSALMTVENISEVYAVVNIEQKDMGTIALGLPAQVTVDTFPGKVFSGTVAVINPVAGSGSRMFKTKIKVNNLDANLKPGMFVKAAIAQGTEQPIIMIPQKAVYQKQGLSYVYVIQNNKALKKVVEVGRVMGDEIEIKSGLEQGAVVASSNVTQLKDGNTVQVVQ